MTTYRQDQGFVPNDSHAPILPADRERAAQLWEQVTGTDLEHSYRAVSARHADKSKSRAAYRAFLDEIEALFVQPEPDADAPLWDDPTPAQAAPTDAPPSTETEDAEDDSTLEQDADDNADIDDAADVGDTTDDASTPSTPVTTAQAASPSGQPGTGLFSQLYGMLHDGGEVTVQVMRVGEQLTVGLFPKPVPGETDAPGVVVTQDAAWFDTHLVRAMPPRHC